MAQNMKATRLGDILVEKGLINSSQLKIAIDEQKRLRATIDPNDKAAMEVTSIGEVLINLGYINHQQLKRGLGWQMSLRRMTFAMALFAPLMSLGSGAAAQVTTSSSSSSKSSTASTLPLTVQAEDYSSMFGIQAEPTSDVGGGLNVGYFHAGDWLSYSNTSFMAAQSGNYKVTYRVATNGAGASFALHEADKSIQYDVVELPNTGGFQKWIDVERTVNMSAGVHSLGLTTLARGAGFNFNWFKVEYKGLALPVTIQAEDYTAMSGIQTEPTSDTGGGLNVGYFHEKDWLSYSDKMIDIPKTGAYKITLRVASLEGGGSLSFHEADGSATYASVNIPKTGAQQAWVNVEQTVQLTAGSHKFGFTTLARGAKGFNLNWFKIEPVDAPATVSSSSSSVASSQPAVVQSSSSSSAVVMPSSSSSSVAATTSSSGAVSSAASSTNSVTNGEAYFKWTAPTARANGDLLSPEDLGGYEIRYRLVGDAKYSYISTGIGPWDNSYVLKGLTSGSYVFEIAAYDKNGIYSQFVSLKAL
jgi:hypothetical protein